MDSIIWFIGLFLAIAGGWRLIWRLTLILGLVGANKAGTAKGDQVDKNKANVDAMKKGLPIAAIMLAIGLLAMFLSDKFA